MTGNLPEIAEPGPSTIFALIERIATNPDINIANFQALLDMQERLMAREAEREFNAAYARLQMKLPRITKKGEVQYPVNKNQPDGPMKKAFNYARYEDIDELVRPLLNEEGFSLTYDTQPQANGTILVMGTLLHVAGHAKHAQIGPLPLDTSGGKNNLQAVASTFSYGKRYCCIMLINLVFEGEDDDGVRGGMVFITPADIAQIEALIAETKSDRLRFLEYMGVAELENIQVREKDRAITALMQKKRPPQTGGTDQAARGARGGSGESSAAGAAETNPRRAAVVDPETKPREAHMGADDLAGRSSETNPRPSAPAGAQQAVDAAGAGGSPAIDIVTELDRRLTEAAQQGKRALDNLWIKLEPLERDLARPRRQHYYDIAARAEG